MLLSVILSKVKANVIMRERGIRNEKYFFKEGLSWKRIGSSGIGLRFYNALHSTSSDILKEVQKNIDSERFYFYSHNLNVEDNIKLLYSNLNGIKIKDIQIIEPSLQDIYIQIMKEKINNEG